MSTQKWGGKSKFRKNWTKVRDSISYHASEQSEDLVSLPEKEDMTELLLALWFEISSLRERIWVCIFWWTIHTDYRIYVTSGLFLGWPKNPGLKRVSLLLIFSILGDSEVGEKKVGKCNLSSYIKKKIHWFLMTSSERKDPYFIRSLKCQIFYWLLHLVR